MISILFINAGIAQQIPTVEENIPFLVTFGKECSKSWGDDDFSQTFFFVIPKYQTKPVYIRVYDPDVSGQHDEQNKVFNTKTQFSVYAGKSCFTAKDVKDNQPKGDYKSGNLLSTKTFETENDNEWYSFGPYNPSEGEFVNEYGGYIFKVIAEGISGDDGNMYRYFLSESPTENKAIEGSNAFTFEYTFRLPDKRDNITHLYPYIEENVVSVKISIFDYDDDGEIGIISMASKGLPSKSSGDNEWASIRHVVVDKEKSTTLDVQFIRDKKKAVKNNNITLYVTNQYGDILPIFTVPIGGSPRGAYKIQFDKKKKTVPF